MNKIYRYEKNGTGPYLFRHEANENNIDLITYTKLHNKMLKTHSLKWKHPSIIEDLINNNIPIDNTHLYFCGCESIKELKQWFKGFNAPLIRLGFKVVEIEVNKVYKTTSGKQCAYKKEDILQINLVD